MLLRAVTQARAASRSLSRRAGAVYRWPRTKVVALDLECTGINTYRDRILQYGIYGVDTGGETIEVSAMVDAEVPTGRDPYRIPGVSSREVMARTPLRDGHLDAMWEVCDGAVVLIHNRSFDWPMLEHEFKRNKLPPPTPTAVICTLYMAKYGLRLNPPHRLGPLCDRYDATLRTAHNARHDAEATFRLGIILANRYWDQPGIDPLRPFLETRSGHWLPTGHSWARRLVRGTMLPRGPFGTAGSGRGGPHTDHIHYCRADTM
jgi:DNA polymerase III alpha subunit (gram-positive type)